MLAVFREICAVGSTTVFDVKGLTVDGIPGPQTKAALQAALAAQGGMAA